MTKVHLIGGDSQGWALDVDLRMTKQALTGVVELVDSPQTADVIQSVNVEMLVHDPRIVAKLVPGKPVVAQFTSLPSKLFEDFPGLYDKCQEWICVAQTEEAFRDLQSLRAKNVRRIPYVAELASFFPVSAADSRLQRLREELRIPAGKYIVGSFVRDSLGADLTRFKPQKGADVYLAILLGVAKEVGKDRLHVLMAGPRRHWLRNQLDAHGISYTFDGEITPGDDNPRNILPLERLNLLLNLVDLYLIPSRWEGAPAGLFHAIACRKKVVSSDIAAPHEVLPAEARFSTLSRAIEIIAGDIRHDTLSKFIEPNHQRVMAEHTPKALTRFWREIYGSLAATGTSGKIAPVSSAAADMKYSLKYKILWKPMIAANRVRQKLARAGGKSITIWGELVDGPYGGGSQALKAIAAELGRRGYEVHNNALHDSHGHIMNSAFFDQERAKSVIRASARKPRVIHRIDGPISIYRGKERAQDEEVFRLNREIATATAFQCHYSWEKSLELGFDPVSPMIIRNAVDPAFFHPSSGRKAPAGRKTRIVSSSWSTNQIKGFDVYQTLDASLDWSRYEYRFIGRSPVEFKNIRMVKALPSKELGEELRWGDIYITASLHDPASNSLLEAIACGLPVLYRRSGGHAEIAGFAGIPYDDAAEIPALLGKIERHYESYAMCTYNRPIAEITDQYLQALGL